MGQQLKNNTASSRIKAWICLLWSRANLRQRELQKEMLNLQENIMPFWIIAIGYPAYGQEIKSIDSYDEKRVHYESFKTDN